MPAGQLASIRAMLFRLCHSVWRAARVTGVDAGKTTIIRVMSAHTKDSKDVDLSQLRVPYSSTVFTEEMLVSRTDPFKQFGSWLQAALDHKDIMEATSMCLSTCTKDGRPSSRMLLMKQYSDKGFVFFTNGLSRKGRELEQNPVACLLFNWEPLHRQVRIEGSVEHLSEEDTLAYFNSRPRANQISACVSQQSSVVSSREELEEMHRRLLEEYRESDGRSALLVPKPPSWRGYRLVPHLFEFWQGQSTRLHDRIVFELAEGGGWTIKRLAP